MIDIASFKEKLEQERMRLEHELATVGKRNPENPADWVATHDDFNNLSSDRNEVADTFEDFGENTAILNDLEIEYNEVKDALGRVNDGSYGVCAECGKEIPRERLDAFPAARSCLVHVEKTR